MDEPLLDFENVCRVCLEDGKMMSVFKVDISKKLMACASIQVWESDGLPDQICNKCTVKLGISFQFKKLCEKSDARLRQQLLWNKKVTTKQYVPAPRTIQQQKPLLETPTSCYFPVNEMYHEAKFDPFLQQPHPPPLTTVDYNVQPQMEFYSTESIEQAQGGYAMHLGQLQYGGIMPQQVDVMQQEQSVVVQQEVVEDEIPPRMHTDKRLYKCTVCGKGCRQAQDLEKHMRTHTGLHNQTNNMAITNNDELQTALTVKEEIKNENDIFNENNIIIKQEEQEILCEVPNKIENNEIETNNIKIEEKLYFPDHAVFIPDFKDSIEEDEITATDKFTNNSTPDVLNNSDNLEMDNQILGNFTTNDSKKLYTKMDNLTNSKNLQKQSGSKDVSDDDLLIKDLKKKLKDLNKSRIQCDICGKNFTEKWSLTKHTRIHLGIKPHKCDKCEKCFTLKTTLNRHILTHLKKKQFKCEKCPETFTHERYLGIHKRSHEIICKCNECEQCIKQKKIFITYDATLERLHKCDKCEKSFINKQTLRNHYRKHTGEKPYKCNVCQKAFALKQVFKLHEMRHSDEKKFECDKCGKKFILKIDLQSHCRANCGEKRFKCDHCDKSYTGKQQWNMHVLKHMDILPYK